MPLKEYRSPKDPQEIVRGWFRQKPGFRYYVTFVGCAAFWFCGQSNTGVCASCVFRDQRVRASCSTRPSPSGLVALDLARSRQSYLVCCVASSREPRKLQQARLIREMSSIPRAAYAIVRYKLLAGGTRNVPPLTCGEKNKQRWQPSQRRRCCRIPYCCVVPVLLCVL